MEIDSLTSSQGELSIQEIGLLAEGITPDKIERAVLGPNTTDQRTLYS